MFKDLIYELASRSILEQIIACVIIASSFIPSLILAMNYFNKKKYKTAMFIFVAPWILVWLV